MSETNISYNVGDIVEVPSLENSLIGVIKSIRSETKLEICVFPIGELPEHYTKSINDVHVLKPEAGIERLKSIHQQFEGQITERSLMSAVAARKQFHLDQILERVDDGKDLAKAVGAAHLEPTTGIYVLAGIYLAGEPYVHEDVMQGLLINLEPKIELESDVAKLMKILYPRGFGSIPREVPERGKLTDYHAFEVPAKAKHHITKMKTLNLQLR